MGGRGGNASSSLTLAAPASRTLSVSSSASGGAGALDSMQPGGTAAATTTVTGGTNPVSVFAMAQGGDTLLGNLPAGGPTPDATAAANSSGLIVTSNAAAVGGVTGSTSLPGAANAKAIADGGGKATAHANARGGVGSAVAEASYAATVLRTHADGPATANPKVEARANLAGRPDLGVALGVNAAALATASPQPEDIFFGLNPHVVSAFQNANVTDMIILGGSYSQELTVVGGAQFYSTSATVNLDVRQVQTPHDLLLGLYDPKQPTANGKVQQSNLAVQVGGKMVVFHSSSSLNAALAYFTDNVIDLGAAYAQGGTTSVQAQITLVTQVAAPGDGLYVNFILGTGASLPGDANHDGMIDFQDLLILAQNYGSSNQTWEHADFNGDAKVSFDDLLILAQHYGQSTGGPRPPRGPAAGDATSPVPEPSTLAGVTFTAASMLRRRRSKLWRQDSNLQGCEARD